MILVDDEDKDILGAANWSVGPGGYVRAWYQGSVQDLHRVIMKKHQHVPDDMVVDHRDNEGPKSDCRKSNLRVVTRAVNLHNTATWARDYDLPKGIHQHRGKGYYGRLVYEHVRYATKTYDTLDEALTALNEIRDKLGLRIAA